nr:MAG TPA: hypothetical protein [Caudoviricetes sp.]
MIQFRKDTGNDLFSIGQKRKKLNADSDWEGDRSSARSVG